MLRSMKDFEQYTIGAADGIIGRVRDFYFDDVAWVVRYLVVGIDEEPTGRNILISPIAIGRPNWSEKILPTALTRNQVNMSPNIDTDKPISRQHEMGYVGYYGYGNYWGGGGLWGGGVYPDLLQAGLQINAPTESNTVRAGIQKPNNPHLRSGNELARYYVHAKDGDIGHVQGFVLDESSWAVRYIVVNTSNWWLGHQVVIAPEWIDNVDWANSKLLLNLTRQAVKDSPAYDPAATMHREQEVRVFSHYQREGYWHREAKHAEAQPRL
jgi:hypothetical protein